MDFLSELLRAASFEAVVVGQHHLGPRRCLEVDAGDHIGFLIARGGACQLSPLKGDAAWTCRLKPGNVAIFPQGDACLVAPEDGKSANLISGHFEIDRKVAAPLLQRLPALLFLCPQTELGTSWQRMTLDVINDELASDSAGSRLVVQRMLEMFFTYAARRHLAPEVSGLPATAAPVGRQIGAALAALHRHPERDWTVAALARLAHMSTPTFVRQFKSSLLLPPLRYLAQYRMKRAADLLAGGQRSLAEIAARCGYRSEAALVRAFKRHYNVAPGRYGRALRAKNRSDRSSSAS